eukprot:CAMPEP_0185791020 /NCGR_PEP_ID=MMETSP1174-20130828/158128_1 /TAXON_ID=35687 /ORGANISM="Dictyocha speculum, Strain CCMP1381" /LENGTH=305 /DNA_ID=CAMNT_0028485895 /DNA_START=413 /DNA_END=1330 /DNA_ORIENTATION=-
MRAQLLDPSCGAWRELRDCTTSDGFKIEAVVMYNPKRASLSAGGDVGDEKASAVAIFFLGNGGRYELAHAEMEAFANTFGVAVVGFNYRGVGGSEGIPWRFDDLVCDGEAVVRAVKLDEKLSHARIIFNGHSLGAAVAAFVAKDAVTSLGKTPPPPCLLVSDRSFSSLSSVPSGWLRKSRAMLPPSLYPLLQSGADMILPVVMEAMGWRVDVAELFRDCRLLSEVTILTYSPQDEIIPLDASLFSAMDQMQVNLACTVRFSPSTGNRRHRISPHNDPISASLDADAWNTVKEALVQFIQGGRPGI